MTNGTQEIVTWHLTDRKESQPQHGDHSHNSRAHN